MKYGMFSLYHSGNLVTQRYKNLLSSSTSIWTMAVSSYWTV